MKCKVSLLVAAVMLLSLFSCVCFGAVPDAFAVEDPSPQMIAGAVENAIDALYDTIGGNTTLHFAFSPQGYADLMDFKEQISPSLLPLMRGLFAADMAGRDYVTVRTSYGMLTAKGVIAKYYYSVEITVHPSVQLRQEMDRLLAAVQGMTPTQQVIWLQNYLHENIVYDEGTMDASGTYLALMEKRAVCMGYSRALMELCRRLNIPCIALVNETHMWNAVYLDGVWQMLDVTWNIPLCAQIDAQGHEFDPSEYRKAQYYYQNRWQNRGKAKSVVFTDLTSSWYKTAVEYSLGRDLFKGMSDTAFAPDEAMTRGMFVTVLGRLAGATPIVGDTFTDVAAGEYYAGYVNWAQQNGIVNGIGGGNFAPGRAITRQELCKMAALFCVKQNIALPADEQVLFADHAEIAGWARNGVYTCRAAGLVQGKGKNKFDPNGLATRAEVATILYNLCKNYL